MAGGACVGTTHGSIALLILSLSVCVMESEAMWMLSEQWDKEGRREGGGRDKTGGERMGEKADGCFWSGPPPLPPFSLHAEPRPCLIVLIIFQWPFHTRICKRTRMRLLFPPLFTLLVFLSYDEILMWSNSHRCNPPVSMVLLFIPNKKQENFNISLHFYLQTCFLRAGGVLIHMYCLLTCCYVMTWRHVLRSAGASQIVPTVKFNVQKQRELWIFLFHHWTVQMFRSLTGEG